ncbi:hypothetical protein [Spiroplasma turonicum]|nr:hypothetical protein [Spiroplasma turonicum]
MEKLQLKKNEQKQKIKTAFKYHMTYISKEIATDIIVNNEV